MNGNTSKTKLQDAAIDHLIETINRRSKARGSQMELLKVHRAGYIEVQLHQSKSAPNDVAGYKVVSKRENTETITFLRGMLTTFDML